MTGSTSIASKLCRYPTVIPERPRRPSPSVKVFTAEHDRRRGSQIPRLGRRHPRALVELLLLDPDVAALEACKASDALLGAGRNRSGRSVSTVSDMADFHPGIAALAPLLGTWAGEGHGDYPTIEPFSYLEEVTFGHSGKPFLTYSQRTRSEAGEPLHAETGYVRLPAPPRIELILAHPIGITEIDEGTFTEHDDELHIDVHSTTIGLAASARDVMALRRSITVRGDELRYTVLMAAVGQPLVHHLTATLHRQR